LIDLYEGVSQIRELKVNIQSIGEVSLPVTAINFFQINFHCIVLHAGWSNDLYSKPVVILNQNTPLPRFEEAAYMTYLRLIVSFGRVNEISNCIGHAEHHCRKGYGFLFH